MISSTVVADSISEQGVRIVTLSLTYPRFIHSEFMTHRSFVRNSASSRAIPVNKMIASAIEDRAYPEFWGKNKPGMQAAEEIEDKESAIKIWDEACLRAIESAKSLVALKVHKQIANRLLEPFIHTKTLVTSTEWDNFYKLRRHKDAQPEIKALADAMYESMNSSIPKLLMPHQWHKPYCQDSNEAKGLSRSVARCARVSYMTHEGKETTQEQDIDLAKRLFESGHWSPFEHQARPVAAHFRSNNFKGWEQLRKIIENDSRYEVY